MQKEFRRQLVHISGLGIAYMALKETGVATGLCVFATVFFLFLSLYSRSRKDLRKKLPLRVTFLEQLEDVFFQELDKFGRPKEYKYLGAMTFFLGASVVLYFFPAETAVLSIVVLSVGDSLSTLVGVNFGRHALFCNPKKTWEGFLAGLVGSFMACMFLTSPLTAFIASFAGSSIEVYPDNLNDNLTIPVIVSLVLSVV